MVTPAIMFIMMGNLSKFQYSFHSPQVKRNFRSNLRNFTFELRHRLPNDSRLKKIPKLHREKIKVDLPRQMAVEFKAESQQQEEEAKVTQVFSQLMDNK